MHPKLFYFRTISLLKNSNEVCIQTKAIANEKQTKQKFHTANIKLFYKYI